MTERKVYFVGAGPGDPELITVKGRRLLESAKTILYTGSLVPEEVLQWAPGEAVIESSEKMDYQMIFDFILKHIDEGPFIRLHTGDPSLYSTTARQIEFLKENGIDWEVIPGVTAAFAAAASLGVEFTLPGVSQNVVLTRVPGKTPNPEPLENLLRLKNSSLVFYLSAALSERLRECAMKECGWSGDTPCRIVVRASWPDERILECTLETLPEVLKGAQPPIRGTALIFLGEFLNQKETETSHLYRERGES